jgi:hypothetical protein
MVCHDPITRKSGSTAPTPVCRNAVSVTVDVGKPFDVLALKGADLREIRSYAAKLA